MALCKYCGKIEIAWSQGHDKRWVACHAQRAADGSLLKVAVRAGERTVMRPVPDTTKRHFPHADPAAGRTTEAECAEWTPAKAAARAAERPTKGRRHWGGAPAPALSPMAKAGRTPAPPAGAATWTTPGGLVAPVSAPLGVDATGRDLHMGVASAIPTGEVGVGSAAPAPAAKPKAVKLPSPETLMDKAHLAAWARAEAVLRSTVTDLKTGAMLLSRVLLWGPPGTGKTELPWRIAQELGWSHHYQLMTEETPAVDLLGHLIVQAGSTVWCDGSLGRAIRASQTGPTVLVIDEIGRASADAMSAGILALTNPESLRLTLRSGEVITPNPAHWHVVCTSNDDPSILNSAIQSRLHVSIKLLGPNPELVRSLTTIEARRAACSASREYDMRALLTYDRLRATGLEMAQAAGLTWEPEVAYSFVDAARVAAGGAA